LYFYTWEGPSIETSTIWKFLRCFFTWEGLSKKKRCKEKFHFLGKVVSIPIKKHFITEGKSLAKSEHDKSEYDEIVSATMKKMVDEIYDAGFIPLDEPYQLEKYETIDPSSDNILILFRAPCRMMTPKELIEF
jgi:hypothetical protein